MLAGMMPRNGHHRKVSLRPYQEEAIPVVHKEWSEGRNRVLLVQPCGTGKTTLGGRLIADEVEKGNRALVCCHTRKLCRQFAQRVEDEFGIPASVEMAGEQEDGSPCVATTVQTMSRRIEQGKFHPEEFSLLLFDEAHLSLGQSFQSVAKHFEKARIVGLTATPRAAGKKDLLKFYDSMPVDVKLQDMISQGYLAPLTIKNIPIHLRLEQEKKSGDFTDEDCGRAIEGYMESIADSVVEHGRGRCCLIFLPLISLSKKFTDLLTERGFRAKHVDGEMEESQVERIKRELEMGDIECVCCSLLWTIGIDLTPVNLICSLRATKSWVLFSQMMGRGTRLFDPAKMPGSRWPKKTDCVILDPLWEVEDHSLLQRPPTLFASDDEETLSLDLEIKKQIAKGGSADLMFAASTVREQKEEMLRKRLQQMQTRQSREINAVDFFLSIQRADLADYEPLARWERENMTDGQRDFLLRNGFDISTVTSKGMASKIVDSIIQRTKAGLGTVKQCKFAASLGHPDPFSRSFQDLGIFITQAKSGKDAFAEIPNI